MDILVGYTGFVGSNLCEQHQYDGLFNSKNIQDAFGSRPSLLVYSGVPSEMFTANADPERDRAITENAFENIRRIDPQQLVLISTVAVYDRKQEVDEDHSIDPAQLTPYGRNRYFLEQQVAAAYPDSLILRLPAIYGKNLKKNFIYDCIRFIPALLKQPKYQELAKDSPLIRTSYADRGDGFYRCMAQDEAHRQALKAEFLRMDFSALHFTDSRSVYQFLDLKYLDSAITGCLNQDIHKINLVPPPVSAGQVYRMLFDGTFENHCQPNPICYDLKTKHTDTGYIMDLQQTLADIRAFVEIARN